MTIKQLKGRLSFFLKYKKNRFEKCIDFCLMKIFFVFYLVLKK